MQLEQLGWAELHDSAFAQMQDPSLLPARVCCGQREHYRLWTEGPELDAQLSGSFRHHAGALDMPVVGDFVAVRPHDDGARATIIACLPRRSVLVRKRPARSSQPQLIAANLDLVFVVSSLNHDFNPRRIERALAMIWESGAQPVLVLSKLDLCDDATDFLEQAEAVALGVPIVALSAVSGTGLSALQSYLRPGHTVALIGSSGVGKSTLLNALVGEQRMHTAPIRASDGRGKHTTTARELFALPGGALLIDTPGMRELGLWGAQEGLADTFEDITALTDQCRFPDCRHESEPNCAVLAALTQQVLDEERYRGFMKLQRELAHEARRGDARAQLEHRTQLRRVFRERKRALRQLTKR